MITQARLKELLHYDPDTGVFTWKVYKGPRAKAGSEAGSIYQRGRTYYIRVQAGGARDYAHRLAWLYTYGKYPENQIDHIDHDGLNNRIKNLREVSHRENLKNRRLYLNNTSGVIGVSFYSPSGKWRAIIGTNSGNKHLGFFADIEDAIKVRRAAEMEFGYHENHGQTVCIGALDQN